MGYKFICHLKDEFEYQGPNETHVCLVFQLCGERLLRFGAWDHRPYTGAVELESAERRSLSWREMAAAFSPPPAPVQDQAHVLAKQHLGELSSQAVSLQ